MVGTGLSDVSLPTLYFLDPMYDPTFYIKNFLWLENNALLTLILIGGLPFIFKQTGLSYYCALLFSLIFFMTNLLSHAAIRYAYYFEPFLILPASAITVYMLDSSPSYLTCGRFHTLTAIKKICNSYTYYL